MFGDRWEGYGNGHVFVLVNAHTRLAMDSEHYISSRFNSGSNLVGHHYRKQQYKFMYSSVIT